MGILTTPLEELHGEEKEMAEHLIGRLQEVDDMFQKLHKQTELIIDNSNRIEKFQQQIRSLSDEQRLSLPEESFEKLVEQTEKLDNESLKIVARADQTQVVYDFYVTVASALEEGSIEISEAKTRIKEIEENIDWIDHSTASFSSGE